MDQVIDGHELRVKSRTALTIAGFDPSSGAGITADLAVFAAHGMFGTSAITALTVQSTRSVFSSQATDATLLRETLKQLDDDLPADGIKIGMLANEAMVNAVADFLESVRQRPCTVVLDPVLQSSSGKPLLSYEGVTALMQRLLPLVHVITPNTDELAVLTGHPCRSSQEVEAAAIILRERNPGVAVVATGGHLEVSSNVLADLLVDQGGLRWFSGERLGSRATHGTGCAFSSALLCELLLGRATKDAVPAAKVYVREAIRRAYPRGLGKGPMNLLWPLQEADLPARGPL